MTTTWAQTLQKIRSGSMPGSPGKPEHPAGGARLDCKSCNGYGYHTSQKYGGNWFLCECVVNTANELAANRKPDLSRIGLVEIELSMNWGLINPKIGEGMRIVNALKPKYEQGWGMVYMHGLWGQAKTLALKVITATAFRDGKRASYANMSRVLDDIRLAYDEQEHKMTELIRRMDFWCNRDVLCIDELDKVGGTDWAYSRIFELLDRRYATAIREEGLTVIASNKSDSELDGYLKSRLNDNRLGPVMELHGTDGRQVIQTEWKY